MERRAKNEQKEEKGASRHEMASMMHICSGLVGPKSGNVGFSLVLFVFFEGSRESPEDANRASNPASRTAREGEKVILLIKNALWLYSELCFLCWRGAHFQKNHEKMLPGSEKWDLNYVGYIKKYHQDGAWWDPKVEMLVFHWF